jgi:hypothetical protein
MLIIRPVLEGVVIDKFVDTILACGSMGFAAEPITSSLLKATFCLLRCVADVAARLEFAQ